MKKLLLTGGGTAGHVTPNIAMLPLLREQGYDISYIGSYNGIEKSLLPNRMSLITEYQPASSDVIST